MRQFFWKMINKIDSFIRYISLLCSIKKAKIVLTATSAQTNLGDHAISIAEKNFFENYFSDDYIVEIPKEIYLKKRKAIIKKINPKSIIVISGGGFLGDLWMTEENLVRTILKDLKNNKIIIFPQTIFFSDNSDEYDNTFINYKNAKDLIVNARDKNSYELLMKELPENKVKYLPDIVLFLNYTKHFTRKNLALLCFRTDKENCISDVESYSMINSLKKYIEIKETTTIEEHIVPISFRKKYVQRKLDEIASAKLVVTNRLHMMIFAAITGTPCIAIDNISHKVSGVYEWIKDLSYVHLLEDSSDFEEVVKKMLELTNCSYNRTLLMKYYSELSYEFKDGKHGE